MKKLFLILVLLAATACAIQKHFMADIQKVHYRELLAHHDSWQQAITTLQGNARITVDSPQYSGNFAADILMNGRDSLLISVKGPLGVPVGKVFLAKNRFIFYNQLMNQFITGLRKDFDNTNFLQFPVAIKELENVFLARDQFEILKKTSYEVRDRLYYLEADNAHLHYHIWFDPQYMLIRKIEYWDKDRLLFYKTYDQYTKFNGIYFPRAINFVRPDESQGLSIYFTDLLLNEKLDSKKFEIKISDTAKQINLSLN